MNASPGPATLSRRARRSEDVLIQEVGGEAVLLDLASERYFGLDPVGTRIWELLADAPTLADVHATLCTQYDAESARISADLLALANQLADAGLIRLE